MIFTPKWWKVYTTKYDDIFTTGCLFLLVLFQLYETVVHLVFLARLWPVPDPAETPQALSAVRIKAYQNQLILSRQADTFLVDTAILGLVAVFLLTGSWLSLDWSGSFWASCRADVCFLADTWLLSRLLACYQLLTSCKAALSRQR